MTVVYPPNTFENQLVSNFVINACYCVKVALNNTGGNSCTVSFQKMDGQIVGPRVIYPSQATVIQLSNLFSFTVDTTPSASQLQMEIVTCDEDIDPKYLGAPQTSVGGVGGGTIGVIDTRQIRRLDEQDSITIANSFLDVNITNSVVDITVSGIVDVSVSGVVDVTGSTVNVGVISGVVDANITNSSVNVAVSGIVDVSVSGVVDVTGSTVNVGVISGVVDANITNSSVNVAVSGIVDITTPYVNIIQSGVLSYGTSQEIGAYSSVTGPVTKNLFAVPPNYTFNLTIFQHFTLTNGTFVQVAINGGPNTYIISSDSNTTSCDIAEGGYINASGIVPYTAPGGVTIYGNDILQFYVPTGTTFYVWRGKLIPD
jgi:hypothetical protein